MIIDAFVGNIFSLKQNVTSNNKVQSVASHLSLQQVARSNMILQSVGNSFILRGVPAVTRPVTVGRFSDALNLSSTQVTGPGTLSVTSTFFFWQQIVTTGFKDASSHLTLAQTIAGHASKPASSLLTLTQSVSLTARHVQSASSILSLVSQQAAFKPSICFANGQDPILHNPNPYFSYTDQTVTLVSPEFGNIERISQNRIMRRSRAGDLIIFRDNQWPATETLHMDFTFLNQVTATALVDFMRQTMGLRVTFFDNEQRTWHGYIMTPAAQIAEQLRNCFTVTLEFQGTQVPLRVQQPVHSIGLVQELSFIHTFPFAGP